MWAPTPTPVPTAFEPVPQRTSSIGLPRNAVGATRIAGSEQEAWAVQRRRGERIVRTADELLEMLRSDPEAMGRRLAAAALASADTPESVAGALMIAAASDRDPTVRATAARSLGRLGAPAVMPVLIEAADSDPDATVRVAAVTAIAELGGASVMGALTGALAHDRSEHVRAQAALLLGRSGQEAARGPLEHALSDDTSRMVRRMARAALDRLDRGGR